MDFPIWRYSPKTLFELKRLPDRMSPNGSYRALDSEGTLHLAGESQEGESGLHESATAFYRMRLRDAAVYDAPELRLLEFFGEDAGDVVSLEWTVPGTDILMVQRALENLLADWKHLGDTPAPGRLFNPLPRRSTQIGAHEWDFMLDDCHRFWISPEGLRLCVSCRIDETSMGIIGRFGFHVRQRDHGEVRRLWKRIDDWITQNHFLRGKKIDAFGKFLELPDGDAWEALVLPQELRERIEANTVRMLSERERYAAAGIPLKRGIILHGPPGTGKTMIGRALAQRWPGTFILVTPGVMEDADGVREVFAMARRLAPTLLFFEDLDLIGPSRHRRGDTEILGEMLSALDGLETSAGIITVATTNDLPSIEPALKDRPSRFDLVLEISPLGEPERHRFLTRWLETHPHEEIALDPLVEKTKSFTGAQLQELCRSAMIEALNEKSGPPMLKEQHWTKALAALRRATHAPLGFNREGGG